MRTAPAHYVRANELTRQPRCFIYVDTEATTSRTAHGDVQTWRCGVTAHDCIDHHRGEAVAREWADHATPDEMWAWIAGRARPGRRCVVVAHNLAYDLRIAKAFTILPALGWACDQIRLDKGQAFARWRNGTRTIAMVDSLSWLAAPVWQLGEMVGRPKPTLPAEDAHPDEWLARCRADVAIIADAYQTVLRWCEDADLGNWHPTGAGQAWAAWRHRFMTWPVLIHDNAEASEAERASVYSGRTEAWMHGDLNPGPWFEWDASNAYATICRDVELPTKLLFKVTRWRAGVYERMSEHRAVLALCDVDTPAPVVPFRDDVGICWPTGTFTSWLWDNEVALARANGATVVPGEAWVYRRAPFLQEWAEWLLGVLDPASAAVGPVERLAAKHWGRALVGRFGTSWAAWEPFGEALNGRVGLSNLLDIDTGERHRIMHLGTTAMIEGDVVDGPDSFPAVMAYVMAESRCRLWVVMQQAGLANVAHVDTDGLIVNGDGDRALSRAEPVGFRRKAGFDRLTVLGPRQMICDRITRASGVPTKSRQVAPRRIEGDVWRALTTSLSCGESDRVIVRRRTWNLKGTDKRRAHLPEGKTRELVVVGGLRSEG